MSRSAWRPLLVLLALLLAALAVLFVTGEEAEGQTTLSKRVLEPTGALVPPIPEYSSSWAKPWLRDDFLAPQANSDREALWGPVVGTWTTPNGGQCKEFESGAKLCDYADGSAFVWIVEDYTAWMQHGDGGKTSFSRSGDRPPDPPSGSGSSGSSGDSEPRRQPDEIGFDTPGGIADHAFENLAEERQAGGTEYHNIPGIDMSDPEKPEELESYVYNTVMLVELYRGNFMFGGRFEGPYYGRLITYGPNAGKRVKAYWDEEKQVVIVRDPTNPYGGTVFRPEHGKDYLGDQFPYNWNTLPPEEKNQSGGGS